MKMIRYNTGRLYTEKGQRIAAGVTEDGGILFTDIDRGIDGFVAGTFVAHNGLDLNQSDVQWCYDYHQQSGCYEHPLGRFQTELTALRRYAEGQ